MMTETIIIIDADYDEDKDEDEDEDDDEDDGDNHPVRLLLPAAQPLLVMCSIHWYQDDCEVVHGDLHDVFDKYD